MISFPSSCLHVPATPSEAGPCWINSVRVASLAAPDKRYQKGVKAIVLRRACACFDNPVNTIETW